MKSQIDNVFNNFVMLCVDNRGYKKEYTYVKSQECKTVKQGKKTIIIATALQNRTKMVAVQKSETNSFLMQTALVYIYLYITSHSCVCLISMRKKKSESKKNNY